MVQSDNATEPYLRARRRLDDDVLELAGEARLVAEHLDRREVLLGAREGVRYGPVVFSTPIIPY